MGRCLVGDVRLGGKQVGLCIESHSPVIAWKVTASNCIFVIEMSGREKEIVDFIERQASLKAEGK